MQFGPYMLQEKIGEGGLGEVYKGYRISDGTVVAIKKLHKHLENDPRFVGILQHEMIIASKIDHPNLLKMTDFNAEAPHVYFVTDFIDGWALKGLLQKCGRLPPLVVLCIAYEIIRGLDYLHLRDMIHADLSSGNILLSKEGQVIISDYGLVSDLPTDRFKNELVGTPGYYSPEHVTDQNIGPHSDLYIVGLHIIEMINGEKAILLGRSRDHAAEIYKAMEKLSYRLKVDSNPLQQGILRILEGCLQLRANHRFRDADQLGNYIAKLLMLFNISNPKAAIRQYLTDCRFTIDNGMDEQPIYTGNFPYTLDDLSLLRKC
ncbi:MAG: serine/threonine protein kinase [Pseudobacteriovorax sp.]|nr:serine/threonine protein kinase [Pseudobacteriovorax sp.]